MTREELKEEARLAKAEQYQRVYKCSAAEALQMVDDDEIIDKGGKCDWEVELTKEQKKAQRSARAASRTPSTTKQTRTREPNQDKKDLISAMMGAITPDGEINVLNAEREFEFVFNGVKYKVTMSAPRK